jgi:Threonyl-tRNA synthetase
MITLLIHAERFSYRVNEPAIKNPEEPKVPEFEGQNVLVVFTTVEKGDDENVIKRAANDIIDIASKVKASSVVIYPYAHLSDNLALPSDAVKVLDELHRLISDRLQAVRAPFGWYKAFTISCYGHPLSELSRRIRNEPEYQKAQEMSVCEKFGFPVSPLATAIRRATLDWLRKVIPHETEAEGDGDVEEGMLRIVYSEPKGRKVPCVNDGTLIYVRTGSKPEGLPEVFKDSTNEIPVVVAKEGYYEINANALMYYFMVESAKKSPPTLPLWMSPIQVRIIPVKRDLVDKALELASKLRNYRVDVDDTDEGLGKKIARAGTEWVPFVVILGEREVETGNLTVKIRESNEQRQMTLEELMNQLKGNEALSPSPLPLRVSKRVHK